VTSACHGQRNHDVRTASLFSNAVRSQTRKKASCKLALVTTWAGDLWGLRRELVPWLTYHAQLGVSHLYVLYEGGCKNTLTVRCSCCCVSHGCCCTAWQIKQDGSEGHQALLQHMTCTLQSTAADGHRNSASGENASSNTHQVTRMPRWSMAHMQL